AVTAIGHTLLRPAAPAVLHVSAFVFSAENPPVTARPPTAEPDYSGRALHPESARPNRLRLIAGVPVSVRLPQRSYRPARPGQPWYWPEPAAIRAYSNRL